MPILNTGFRILPWFTSKRAAGNIEVSPQLVDAALKTTVEVLDDLKCGFDGLSQEEAEKRLEAHGPNEVGMEKHAGWPIFLLRSLKNPLVILLAVLSGLSFATNDIRGGVVMALMIVLGVVLRFVQEYRADTAAAKLKAMISVTTNVMRNGEAREIPLREVVQGDVIRLAAGDIIPADVRLLSAKDLFITQSSLTGESLPVEKFSEVIKTKSPSPLEYPNLCYMGTSVESGSAAAVVVATGHRTYFGGMAKSIVGQPMETSFDKGVHRFTMLMIQFMALMVPAVFLVNGFTKHDWKGAFFFALAVAVGLTPEMLPMIVSVCLSKGALSMSRKKVVVKRINSIQNLGAMDVLCTDKTGTLTQDHVILKRHCDVSGEEDPEVLFLSYLCSHFQTGLRNVLDRAILEGKDQLQDRPIQHYQKVDEIPFDFSRKMMSVVVESPEKERILITKGAPESIFPRCRQFELDGRLEAMTPLLEEEVRAEYESLSADGFRVLAVAHRKLGAKAAYGREDEQDLILRGYLAFLDPPKESAAPAIVALRKSGITIKILTGDNELVSRKICHDVGLDSGTILLGPQVEKMSDGELAEAAEHATVMARLSPSHKQRVIKALQSKGHVVGFMGDGINDAPALKHADVGISVDTAVDIAKESADMILLEKSLMVLEEGVLEGRKVFANILKYVRMGASSNFGNMFSVIGASAFLPYVPMLPIQVLTNNLLYDFSQVPIPTDNVDPELIAQPRPWAMGEIRKFILYIGPVSSIFDYSTYFVMLYIFKCWDPARAAVFHTGWFVESLMTQTLIIHVIRTNRLPFIQSKASLPITLTSLSIMAVGAALPYSPMARYLGFEPLPLLYWPILAVTLGCYVTLTQMVKSFLLRKGWI